MDENFEPEMDKIESLSSHSRLRLAQKRRSSQIRRWSLREKTAKNNFVPRTTTVKFHPSVSLLEASSRNDIEEVLNLLEEGISPNCTNEDGLTALHQCCIDDSEEMIALLLSHGADVNARDSELWTPLHAAATCGHLHLVKYLIENGAELLAVNADGNMPYDLCEDDVTLSYIENEMAKQNITQSMIDEKRKEIERRMLKDLKLYGNLEVSDADGVTPLHVAAANGYIETIEYLINNDVSLDVVDNDMWQPIHAASCWGQLEAVEILAQSGANINALTKNGETPMELSEDEDIKKYLVKLNEQRREQEDGQLVKRTKSVSSRSQSIRRTSLREKMRTTKKDVQDEKLYRIQNFDSSWTNSKKAKVEETPKISDIIDVNCVDLSSNKSVSKNSKKYSQDTKKINSQAYTSDSPPLNIHVSVTINTNQLYSVSGTLSDLKKQRSQTRNQTTASPTQNTPITDSCSPKKSINHLNNLNFPDVNGRSKHISTKKFTETHEVFGPPSSFSNCCRIL